ncbi:MAG TPA: GDP-mannose 4,6-dehydratase [Spartobacteria bacterium]|jgi:GDPmannose 4,6-dehydratase|nr:GDP-mannose 4,6-dehydratase [Spartobacteria bacterium]HCP91436.1 GDP-mannose 4,6-dehydratase [Spartobacteria bacterium]
MKDHEKIALITGISGQDGSYLSELLLEKNYTVHGIVRRTSNLLRSRIEHLRRDEKIYGQRLFLHYGDLSDGTTLRRIFRDVRPTELYHLAGQSHVGLSFEIPESTCEEAGMATLRLLEIARDQPTPVRFYHASSSEIFGNATETPQTENTPMFPASPYGCAKAFATQLARVYRQSYGLFVCNGILYNHESPRRGENFVTRKIARAVARIARGLDVDLVLGNLESRRDWGRAPDYVQAMWLMLQHKSADDYIVATGETHSVREFVEAAFAVVDLPWKKYVKRDPSFDRPTEPARLVGCADKIRQMLGWKPTGTFPQLVREMVEAELAAIEV